MTEIHNMPSEGLLDYLNTVETYLADEKRKLNKLYDLLKDGALSDLEQDALERNLQLSTEAAIGISKHWVKLIYGSAPSAAKDNFAYLAKANAITPEVSQLWKSIVGTRNILVHDYLDIDKDKIIKILVNKHYLSIFEFAENAIQSIRAIR